MLVNEWVSEKKGQNVIVLAAWVSWEMVFGYYSESSEILPFPWNVLLSSPLELSLIFSRRLFTRFPWFPLPFHLFLSSLSFLRNIHCWADFSFFSRQSEPSAFLGKREAPPDVLSLPISWDWIFSLSYMIVYSQQRMMEQSQPTLIQLNLTNFYFSKGLEKANMLHTEMHVSPQVEKFVGTQAWQHITMPSHLTWHLQLLRCLSETLSTFLQTSPQLLVVPSPPPLQNCFKPCPCFFFFPILLGQ